MGYPRPYRCMTGNTYMNIRVSGLLVRGNEQFFNHA